VTDARGLQPVRLGVTMLAAAREQNPDAFCWHGAADGADEAGSGGSARVPGSDGKKRLFIDLLAGGADLRTRIEGGATPDEINGRVGKGNRRVHGCEGALSHVRVGGCIAAGGRLSVQPP